MKEYWSKGVLVNAATLQYSTTPFMVIRSYLKKVFWPNLGVEPSLQVLDILEYACALKRGPALILNQNPFFELASNY